MKKQQQQIETIIIAMDNGKMNIKSKSGEKEVVQLNRVSNGNIDTLNTDVYNVLYRDRKYHIGSIGGKKYIKEGKCTELNKITTLSTITKFIEAEKMVNIILGYGESVNMYNNPAHKKAIEELLLGRHEIMVDNDGQGLKLYKFNIQLVHVLPEGLGHILSNMEEHQGIEYVVDIGGSTVNFIKCFRCLPIKEESKSPNIGMYNLNSRIRKNLSDNGMFLDDLQTQEYIDLLGKDGKITSKYQEIFEETIYEQLDELDNRLAEDEVNIRDLIEHHPVTFSGGSSETLKKYILTQYSLPNGKKPDILEDALLANVRGIYEFMVKKYGHLVEME